jgi:DegV family protein with EDD domain
MSNVAIVTDTTACILPEQVSLLDIEVVPVLLIINGKAYRDGIDISPSEFYDLLRQTEKTPTTSASSPEPYLEAFQKAGQRASHILCITEPSRYTAMYTSACLARDMAAKILHNVVIEVEECATAAIGAGLVILAAARAAAAGKSLPEVISIARNIMSRVHLFISLDTLHYLALGGRVPQAAAMVNSLLSIKPIFTLNHTEARTIALPRTTDSALNKLLKLMEENVTPGKPLHVAVTHSDALKIAQGLKNRIVSRFVPVEIYITEFTPVMGAHTGPGIIGFACYTDE